MTVQTTTTAIAPSEQGITVGAPKIAPKLAKLLESLNPEALQAATKSGKLAQFSDGLAELYAVLGSAERQARENRTVAGAYVHRAMSLDGKTPGEIGTKLGVSSGRVSQLKWTAKLLIDLDFAPSEAITAKLTSGKMNLKPVAEAIRADSATRASVEAAYAKATAPVQASVGGSAEGSTASGGDTSDTRGAGDPGRVAEFPGRNNSTRLDHFETLVAAMGELSPAEWARLFEVQQSVGAMLKSSNARTLGAEIVKRDREKSSATAQSAE